MSFRSGNPGNPNPSPATRFKKGQPGGPGRPKGFKFLSSQLEEMLNEVQAGQDKSRAQRVLDKLITLAEEGNLDAIRMVFDRLEGKVKDHVTVDSSDTSPRLVIPLADVRINPDTGITEVSIGSGGRPIEASP